MIRIPTFQTTSADFLQNIELGDYIMSLRFTFNIRNGFFRLNITDANDVTVYGIKVVPNYRLIEAHKSYIEFEGDIIVQKDDDTLGDEITYDNFGNGWNPYYLTPAEVEDWKDDNGLE